MAGYSEVARNVSRRGNKAVRASGQSPENQSRADDAKRG